MEVLIGVLTAIILLLLLVFVIILFLNRRQKLQSSPTVLKNPFGFAINMKVKEITRSRRGFSTGDRSGSQFAGSSFKSNARWNADGGSCQSCNA